MTKVLWRLSLLVLVCTVLLPSEPRASLLSPPLTAVADAMPAATAAGQALRQGSLPDRQPLRLAIGLAPANLTAMRTTLASIYNPASPLFHHFLSPREVSARFGPDPARVSALAAWLTSQGLTPQPWRRGGLLLDVRGTAGRVGAAFHTHLSIYKYAVPRAMAASADARLAPATTGYAPDTVPLLPGQFASLVSAIAGLSGAAPAHATAYVSAPAAKGRMPTVPIGYSPQQVASAYDFRPLYAAGLHGERLRVALVELAPYDPDDVAAYLSHFGPAATITSHQVDGGNAKEQLSVEATLDLELLGPSVPGASIDVYNAPNDAAGLLDAFSAVASAGDANVLMLTWVHCEPEALQIDGLVQVQHTLFQTLALQGTTIVAATGDAGAYGCSDGEVAANDRVIDISRPVVSVPASDPYVLGVAGSDASISDGQAASLLSEAAWSCPVKTSVECKNEFLYKGGGSGGGLSIIFHTGDAYGDDLSWQVGPGVRNAASNGFREVPDVSFAGCYCVDPDHDYGIYWRGAWKIAGGTSAAAPFWSALVLLADQYLLEHGGQPLGWIDPLLYRLAASAQAQAPFHDITTGNNLLYSATPGWDYASGWGSPDAWLLVHDLSAAALTTVTSRGASPTVTGTPDPCPLTSCPAPVPTSTATGVLMLQIHNSPHTVVGGRRTACDLSKNINGGLEDGCEVVSSISAPGATVVYTLTYPDLSTETFTDRADSRGHSLHPFNVAYLPPYGARHGAPLTVAHITVAASLPDGRELAPVQTRFSVIPP